MKSDWYSNYARSIKLVLTLEQAYNIVSAQQLRETKKLLQESRHDGKDLTRLVAFLSLFFLPGTFVSVRHSEYNLSLKYLLEVGILQHDFLWVRAAWRGRRSRHVAFVSEGVDIFRSHRPNHTSRTYNLGPCSLLPLGATTVS